MSDTHEKTPNRLLGSSSPYLLQHAYNPVDWHPWGEEALALAHRENKPIIVSIGYAACHWCHVMERESFENEATATLMNRHYVCIKVDREERPDVDQVYMDAVQLMGINGGWPLNVILMPDAKPFYGGTYFQPDQWRSLLVQVAEAFAQHRGELEKSAKELTDFLQRSEVDRFRSEGDQKPFEIARLQRATEKVYPKFDKVRGGMNRAPKFPMPCLWQFLLRYGAATNDTQARQQALFTLREMAKGGIYDQIGGGFARYSVDAEWLAPHFEKMLYDNAQLLSLYSEAYLVEKDELFRETALETAIFLQKEMFSIEGSFFSALDADSEGIEGKFYVWQEEELKKVILPKDLSLFQAYYRTQKAGNWEHGQNILHRRMSDTDFAAQHGLSLEALREKVAQWKALLLHQRSARVRPGLDDKQLTSWNGLVIKGLADAYRTFGEPILLEMAQDAAKFIERQMARENQLWHTYKEGKASLKGFLEDYAAVISGYVALYQASFEEHWLLRADVYTQYVLENFFDETEHLFFFTDNNGERLIARKKEIFDSVIPSSNALMADALHDLGRLLDNAQYMALSDNMLQQITAGLEKEIVYLSKWASLYLKKCTPAIEVAVVGGEALHTSLQLYRQHYHPNCIWVGGIGEKSTLSLLHARTPLQGKDAIYVCRNRSCQLPTINIAEAGQRIVDSNK